MAIALQGVGDKGERTSQHGCPSASYEQERQNLHVLSAAEGDEGKTQGTQHQTDGVGLLHGGETGYDHGPADAAYGLNGVENTRPVARRLVGLGLWGISIPHGERHGVDYIGPHVEEGSPAEELHQ